MLSPPSLGGGSVPPSEGPMRMSTMPHAIQQGLQRWKRIIVIRKSIMMKALCHAPTHIYINLYIPHKCARKELLRSPHFTEGKVNAHET